MTQGSVKKTAPPNPSKSRHRSKKPSKVTKPKKAKTAADKLQKKYTAGVATQMEKMLGERAGHLELIGKGKKGKENGKAKQKGGTRKFG